MSFGGLLDSLGFYNREPGYPSSYPTLMEFNPESSRILVAGSSNVDHIVFTEKLPVPGETIGGGVYRMVFGGNGSNQAVAASRAECDNG